MAIYSGMRIKAYVKPEFRSLIKAIHGNEIDWADRVAEFPFLQEFSRLANNEFIPLSGLYYMPDSWEMGSQSSPSATDGFDYNF